MAVAAFHLPPGVGDIHGVSEFHALETDRGQFFSGALADDRVADITVTGDGFAIGADMVAIVAAEASGKVHVADIVGVFAPVDFHFGENIAGVDAPHAVNRCPEEFRIRL